MACMILHRVSGEIGFTGQMNRLVQEEVTEEGAGWDRGVAVELWVVEGKAGEEMVVVLVEEVAGDMHQ